MSVQAIAWALKQRVGSTGGKCLLLALANYADEEGSCFPGQERLADETDQSVDSVQRRLKDLEALGLITRERRGGSGEGRSSDRYKLHLDQLVLDLKPSSSKAAICGVAGEAKPQSAVLPEMSSEGATPQLEPSKTATVRFSTIDEPSEEPSGIHTPLPPLSEPAEEGVFGRSSVLDQCKVTIAEPPRPPARFDEIAEAWPWEEGESRIQAEAVFQRLGEDDRRHAVAAAGSYVRSKERSSRKRAHLKTYLADRLFLDFPADSTTALPPKQVFIALGTPEFAAWDRAYREAGKPGMPSYSRHENRAGWWRPSPFPPRGWRPETAQRQRDGPEAA